MRGGRRGCCWSPPPAACNLAHTRSATDTYACTQQYVRRTACCRSGIQVGDDHLAKYASRHDVIDMHGFRNPGGPGPRGGGVQACCAGLRAPVVKRRPTCSSCGSAAARGGCRSSPAQLRCRAGRPRWAPPRLPLAGCRCSAGSAGWARGARERSGSYRCSHARLGSQLAGCCRSPLPMATHGLGWDAFGFATRKALPCWGIQWARVRQLAPPPLRSSTLPAGTSRGSAAEATPQQAWRRDPCVHQMPAVAFARLGPTEPALKPGDPTFPSSSMSMSAAAFSAPPASKGAGAGKLGTQPNAPLCISQLGNRNATDSTVQQPDLGEPPWVEIAHRCQRGATRGRSCRK